MDVTSWKVEARYTGSATEVFDIALELCEQDRKKGYTWFVDPSKREISFPGGTIIHPVEGIGETLFLYDLALADLEVYTRLADRLGNKYIDNVWQGGKIGEITREPAIDTEGFGGEVRTERNENAVYAEELEEINRVIEALWAQKEIIDRDFTPEEIRFLYCIHKGILKAKDICVKLDIKTNSEYDLDKTYRILKSLRRKFGDTIKPVLSKEELIQRFTDGYRLIQNTKNS